MAGNNWWATDATASVSEPPAQYKARGFVAGEPLPADFLNWLMQQLTWVYSTPTEAVDDIPAGGTVIVDAVDTDQFPGSPAEVVDTGTALQSID